MRRRRRRRRRSRRGRGSLQNVLRRGLRRKGRR
jgi:hypothetical protein